MVGSLTVNPIELGLLFSSYGSVRYTLVSQPRPSGNDGPSGARGRMAAWFGWLRPACTYVSEKSHHKNKSVPGSTIDSLFTTDESNHEAPIPALSNRQVPQRSAQCCAPCNTAIQRSVRGLGLANILFGTFAHLGNFARSGVNWTIQTTLLPGHRWNDRRPGF